MRIPKPITLLGFGPDNMDDGSFTDEKLIELLRSLYAERHPNGHDTDEAGKRAAGKIYEEIITARICSIYHNRAIFLMLDYFAADRKATAAKRAADAAYDELAQRTTTAWHAAHHRYIIAVTQAQDAIATLLEASAHLYAYKAKEFGGMVASFYDRFVPAADQIPELPDASNLTADAAEFREKHRANIQLLSYTLTGAFPLGLDPDPIPTAQTEPAPTETSAW